MSNLKITRSLKPLCDHQLGTRIEKLRCSREESDIGLCDLFEWKVSWVYCDNKITHFTCHANLPVGVKFARTDVRCTGVAGRPGYVIENSCYLQFSLTPEGGKMSGTVAIVLVSVLSFIVLLSCIAAACGQFRIRTIIIQNNAPSQQSQANRPPVNQQYLNPAYSSNA